MSTQFSHGQSQIQLIGRVCDFLESPAIREAAEKHVPCTMPQTVGGLGFDVPLWMGLGVVGLWAALDAYADRAAIPKSKCSVCGTRCLRARLTSTPKVSSQLATAIDEIEDLRQLFAHNLAGLTHAVYFGRPRHFLAQGRDLTLSSGARFEAGRVTLQVSHLRYYASRSIELLEALE
ncbi:MAG: hypothetical protein ACRD8U_16905 [Pyrinomonadaceae bacterium]